MKFSVQNVKNGCRLGLITDLGKNGNKSIETPMCMLYTRGGKLIMEMKISRVKKKKKKIAETYIVSVLYHRNEKYVF